LKTKNLGRAGEFLRAIFRLWLKMKMGLDHYSREKINAVLEKHGLAMKEEKGFMVISKIDP
jgi:hypothetical protein